jgi:hypothetical protein
VAVAVVAVVLDITIVTVQIFKVLLVEVVLRVVQAVVQAAQIWEVVLLQVVLRVVLEALTEIRGLCKGEVEVVMVQLVVEELNLVFVDVAVAVTEVEALLDMLLEETHTSLGIQLELETEL